MSMISDLVKKLRWIADYDQYQNRNSEVTIRKAADTIEMLSQKARATEQGWIPCSERLPEEGEIVLVCVRLKTFKYDWEKQRGIEFGRINSDRYDFNGTGWEWLNESGADYWQADWNNSILAWMPLPKPWKGADDGEDIQSEAEQ